MRAIICTKYGPPEVLQLQEVAKPIPKEDQILVKIHATAVNSGDVRVRGLTVQGFMKLIMRFVLGFTKPRKPILGTVYSGIVESVGNKVSIFKTGDKVFGMTGFDFGTYAEYIAIKEKSIVSVMPEQASFEEAAALIFGGQTAIYFFEKAKMNRNTNPKVLIIGATGAVGTAALQIAQYYNADITAICSSDGRQLVENLGVSKIILYDKEDITKQTIKFDIILDAVGKTTKKQFKKHLAEIGTYKTVNGLEIASESQEQLEFIKKLFEMGIFKAVIDKTFSMHQVVDAHRYVDTGRKKGNVVLKIVS